MQATTSVRERAKRKLERDIGPAILEALNHPRTVELLLNPDGRVWVERLGERAQCISNLRPAQGQAIVETVAGFLGKSVTATAPLLEGEWPLDGSRFAGQLPPVVPNAVFAIRKKAISIFTLDQYVEAGIMTAAQKSAIDDSVRRRDNILVVGGTGSGKTTLINAIIDRMVRADASDRFVIIEDTGEIQCAASNYVQYHTTAEISMTQLLKTTLRMRPDRILVGEVRGEEALDLLDCWNTGHPGGAATLHSNSAHEGLTRLRSLVSRNRSAPKEIEPLIGEAVQLVVHISRTASGSRRIEEILRIQGFKGQRYSTQNI